MKESLATVLEAVADLRADRTAVVQGSRARSWRELDDRAARLAGYLAGTGIGAQARVGIALPNSIEYLESLLAVLKLRAVPVNVNYRYRRDELVHLFTDSWMQALVFDGRLEPQVAAAAQASPALRTLVRVGESGGVRPAAGPEPAGFADAVAVPPLARLPRGDDHWLMYTGGTTGVPKGVLTRHS
ncbi:MAG: AMP-binding protein, partial [Actinobacteria bacterium]|nr:AMP-binding protein [Actinomycetota bacterium]